MRSHEFFMKRCIELAKNGLGTTYPNPLVGSVIVDAQGIVIGEGWHFQSGEPHAEVNAIHHAEKSGHTDFSQATIYVNLEPCSHTGKTPPCASLIIKKGFKKVVIGTLDPHDKVAGKGVALLKEAGMDCVTGILEKSCNELNKRFFTFHKKNRPYIILKWAETADGFIAPVAKDKKEPVWITNAYSQQRSHYLRSTEQAILVGGKTVMEDNPTLTCRSWKGRNPHRFILDSRNDIPVHAAALNKDAKTTILHQKSQDINDVVKILFDQHIQSIIIEGGTTTLQHFIDHNLWDEAYQFMGTEQYFHAGTAAPCLKEPFVLKSREMIGSDVLKIYLPQ